MSRSSRGARRDDKYFLTGFIDMDVENIPSPLDIARAKTEQAYTGLIESQVGEALTKCDAEVTEFSVWFISAGNNQSNFRVH